MSLPRQFLSACLALALGVSAASAQSGGWIDEVEGEVNALRGKQSCFGGQQPRSLHILGAISSNDLLDSAAQIGMLSDLTRRLSERTDLRVTRADTFQFIAEGSTSTSSAAVGDVGALLDSVANADITVVLRPFRLRGTTGDVDVMLWARNVASRAITCTPSLTVSMRTSDPECEMLYTNAKNSGNPDLLQAFAMFRPDCPQAAGVAAEVAMLRERQQQIECEAAFNTAVAANTVAAFDQFIGSHASCSMRASAQVLRDQLAAQDARQSQCQNAYEVARAANTVGAYEQFAQSYPNCSQTVLARELARVKAEQEEEAALLRQRLRDQQPAAQPAQPVAPAPPPVQAQIQRPQRLYSYTTGLNPLGDNFLSIRSRPSTRSGRRLGKIFNNGTQVEILGREGSWYRVRYQGIEGYSFGRYLTTPN